MAAESKAAIYAAIAGNGALAITKFVVAAITGSAAMLSEGIHSLVDTGNGGLLLLGIRLSKRPPDENHPFGHGLELYFWTLVVAVLIFGVGGGMSAYEGITHLMHPREVSQYFWIYLVLGCGVVFEGVSLYFAVRSFLAVKGDRGTWETIRTTKDPTIFAVLLEDSAALIGLVVAFIGILLGQLTGSPYFDGAASIIIGLVLMAVASVLAWESRLLLIGEGADDRMVASIQRIAEQDQAVQRAQKPLTLHFGPKDVLVNLDLDFRQGLSTGELEAAIHRIEQEIRQQHPLVNRLFLETQSLARNETGNRPGRIRASRDGTK